MYLHSHNKSMDNGKGSRERRETNIQTDGIADMQYTKLGKYIVGQKKRGKRTMRYKTLKQNKALISAGRLGQVAVDCLLQYCNWPIVPWAHAKAVELWKSLSVACVNI